MDQIRNKAPSAFATQPWEGVSDKYAFVSTERIIALFAKKGWYPVEAKENTVRLTGKAGYQKHIIKFECDHKDTMIDGEGRLQALMTNSHDRSSAFILHIGMFRFVCTNGLVIADASFGRISIRHIGFNERQVYGAQKRILGASSKVASEIKHWQSIELDDLQMLEFAQHSLNLKYDGEAPIEAKSLLRARRYEDKGNDLWRVMNRVQENLIQGGDRYRTENNRRQSTRAVKAISEDMRLNKGVWTLAKELAKKA